MPEIRGSCLFAASLLAFFAPAALAAQNLIPNPDFDVNDDFWDPLSPDTVTFARTESGLAACSGSGLATVISASGGQETFVSNPGFAITGGESYSFGGYVLFPSGQDRTGSAKLWVIWTGDCLSGAVVQQAAPIITTADAGSWVRTELTAVAPAGAHCADIHVRLVKNEAGGSLAVQVDGFFLDPRDGFLFENGFENGSHCRWSAVQT